MKLTILIMTLFLVQVSASSRAQITIREKNTTLQKVLDAISVQSGYDFVYSNTDFKDLKPVSIRLDNVSVEVALRAAFLGQPLVYEVSDKTVMVKRKEEVSVMERIKDYFASINVRGRVVDERFMPLEGASVTVKNGKGVINSDANGFFYLKNVDENAILIFSYLGYEKQEISVNGRDNFGDVVLKASTSQLDEVQVQFAGKTSRRISTGNITSVSKEEIAKRPYDNPLLLLQGTVPNLTISPVSGMPGGTTKIQLRGQNSLAGAYTQPLIIIDGVPFTNNFSPINSSDLYFDANNFSALGFVNPSDIESINVLKDADATSIYGSRGGNGVILITTKKGRTGPTEINITTSVGISQLGKSVKYMNTDQYLSMRRKALANDGLIASADPNEFRPGYLYAPDLTLWDQSRYTDWSKVILGQNASTTNVQGSISGGSNNVQYLLSGTFNNQGYIFSAPGHFQNGTGHLNISGASNNQKFRANLTATYTANSTLTPNPNVLAITLAPNAPSIYDSTGALNWEPNPTTGASTWVNPIGGFLQSDKSKAKSLIASLEMSYAILPWLNIKNTVGYSSLIRNRAVLVPIASLDPTAFNNTGTSQFTSSNLESLTLDPILTIDRNISKGKLQILVGASLQSQETDGRETSSFGFTSDALLENPASATRITSQHYVSQYKYFGSFARLNYNWQDKYIINLSGRRDGSSRFGPGNQFGNFASVGAAWAFSNEKIIQDNLKFLSFGKLRFSYGVSGNDGIGDYSYIELFNPLQFGSIQTQGIKPLASNGAINPNFQWENIRKQEWGLDLGFLKDRISISLAYWRNRSSNQLGSQTLAATAGTNVISINQKAKIENSGKEVVVSSINIKSKNFSWLTTFNIGFQNNKLLALPKEFAVFSLPLLTYYSLKQEDPIGKPISGAIPVYQLLSVDQATGDYLFADFDGNPTTDLGSASNYATKVAITPKFSGGLGNTFSYKGTTLSFLLQFIKQKALNFLRALPHAPGFFNTNQPALLLQESIWTKPGDVAEFQRLSQTSFPADFASYLSGQSDKAYMDGSFIRLKNVFLSHEIPGEWKRKFGIRGLNIFLQGQNLLTITKYNGFDPEMGFNTGIQLPQLRTYTIGLNIKL